MTSSCRSCNQAYEITEADLAFYDKISPIFAGKKETIPPPTLCPDCRMRRRAAWRNERKLYNRKCDATGKEIISVFSPDKPYVVYHSDEWYGDAWDAKSYGRDFDFSRPFFDQFDELLRVVPQLALSKVKCENSEYTNQIGWSRACYLIFEADYDDHCYYGNNIYDSRYCTDNLKLVNCELCYQCVACNGCYNLKFSQDCDTCSDSWFLESCNGCTNCFGCVNLQNQEYCFLNEKLTKEKYFERLKSVDLGSASGLAKMQAQFKEFVKKFPHRSYHGTHNEGVVGDYVNRCKDCIDCFDLDESRDCRYVVNCRHMKDCHDVTVFGSQKGCQLCYECHEIGDACERLLFCDQVFEGCYSQLYSKLCCLGSHDLFGCVGMKKSSYCILNKQYSKQEYEALVPRIIDHMRSTGEWGEFFPARLSPMGYNETIAQDYWPANREEALGQGFAWSDYVAPIPDLKLIPASQVPDRVTDVPDSILDAAIECEVTKKPFRLIAQELKYYREYGLPVPRRHPDQRHADRMALRNPRVMYDRACAACSLPIRTTYAPDRPERILCEECYRREVF